MAGFLLAGALFLYLRWPSIVFSLPLNPDEAQATANVYRILSDGLNWDSLDGTTVGPLNSLVLCWPTVFGWDATLSFTRLTAAGLLFVTCLFAYLCAEKLSGRLVGLLLAAPLFAFYGLTVAPDFVHYGSELLPLALLMSANFLLVGGFSGQGRRLSLRFAAAGLLLGCVPFAKLQAAPIAAAIVSWILLVVWRRGGGHRGRRCVFVAVAAATPALCFFVPLLLSGNFSDFWVGYIVRALHYIEEYTPPSALYRLLAADPVLKYVTHLWGWLGVLLLAQAFGLGSEAVSRPSYRIGVACGGSLLAVALWCIARPGKPYAHYLHFFPPFSVVMLAWLARPLRSNRRAQALLTGGYAVAAALLFVPLRAEVRADQTNPALTRRFDTVLPQRFSVRSPGLYSWVPRSSDYMLVWGWMPQWYVWGGLVPATRESHNEIQLLETPLKGYFRSRLLADFAASKPEIVVDAVRGTSFGFNDPARHSLQAFDELWQGLSEQYLHVSPLTPSEACPPLYVRRDVGDRLFRQLVFPKSVVSSGTLEGETSPFRVSNLFDVSVTEDACIDYWLLPDRRQGAVRIHLEGLERVSRLMLLNTQNGASLDRSADEVGVRLFRSGLPVAARSVRMNPFPEWTAVDFAQAPEADRIELYLLSFRGKGAGLNEVKIFRQN